MFWWYPWCIILHAVYSQIWLKFGFALCINILCSQWCMFVVEGTMNWAACQPWTTRAWWPTLQSFKLYNPFIHTTLLNYWFRFRSSAFRCLVIKSSKLLHKFYGFDANEGIFIGHMTDDSWKWNLFWLSKSTSNRLGENFILHLRKGQSQFKMLRIE